MINIFNYIDRPSPIHRLTGATKLICMLLLSFSAMFTYDTRLLIALPILAILLFKISKIRLSDVKVILWITLVYCALNNLMIFLFSPEHGVTLYGTRHVILPLVGRYVVTQEQLFYHFNLLLKYAASIPMVLLFVCTTNPSEFAASLNKVGVSYRISYAVALALRYIPDIQREYHNISQAQQARGIEMSKKESFFGRLKAATGILIPLILSSMQRIETIANAMELRGFGKERKRTWYMGRKFSALDLFSIAFSVLVFAATLVLMLRNGRFYNPFV